MDAKTARNRIAQDLRALGLREAGTVLVHSSLSALGHVPDGAETVVLGLLDALGPRGTLLMPAHTWNTVNPENPVFDARATPSHVGAVTEYFRRRPGTTRSLHPTHSVCAAGPRAAEFLGDHHKDDTPCGPHSPYRRLRDEGGQILMLGCSLNTNTSMHGIEELVEPPYLFGSTVSYGVIDMNGDRTDSRRRSHGFAGWRSRFDRIVEILDDGADIRKGKVLEAAAWLIEAPALWEKSHAALEEDILFFAEKTDAK